VQRRALFKVQSSRPERILTFNAEQRKACRWRIT
jgi:hypothetical protein